METKGLTRIVISVKNMKTSVDFYVKEFGCVKVGEKDLSFEDIKNLWNVKQNITAKSVFMKKGDRPVVLQLVEFSEVSKEYKRPVGNPNYNCGMFDIGFRVIDMQKTYNEMSQTYEFFNRPKSYTAPWTSNAVQEVILWSPDRVPTAFMMSGNYEGDRFLNITTNAYFTKDVDKANTFFIKVLGMDIVFDKIMPKGLVNDILGIPDGDEPRITMAFKKGINSPVPEMILCQHEDAKNINDISEPTAIGLMAAGYEVDSTYDAVLNAKELGYKLINESYIYDNGIDGPVKSAIIIGPDNALFEVYQVIK